MAEINQFDGLVLLGSCDKIVPGMLRIDSVDGDCDALFMAKMRKVK